MIALDPSKAQTIGFKHGDKIPEEVADLAGAELARLVGGYLIHTKDVAASTNATLVKAAPASLVSILIMNASASARFLRLYDKASAPTVGTDIATRVIQVPAGLSKEISFPHGLIFLTGLAYAVTGAAAYNDATAVAAHDVQFTLNYD